MHICSHDCDCGKEQPVDPTMTFYMVYVNGGTQPTKRHADHASAMREAERLASQLRKETYVLKAESVCRPVSQTTWHPLK